jgi:hypothetical protein
MADDDMVTIAKGAGAIVVNLEQVPNQPLTFAGHDGKPHEEDGIIAFSWAQVMKTQRSNLDGAIPNGQERGAGDGYRPGVPASSSEPVEASASTSSSSPEPRSGAGRRG